MEFGERLRKDYSVYRILRIPKKYRMPNDITRSRHEDVRALQSYYTNLLSYLHVALAHAKVKLATREGLAEDHRRSSFVRINDKLRSKQTKEYVNSVMANEKGYKKVQVKLLKAKAVVELYQSFILVCETIIKTASREQSFREAELKGYYGRGGQGA